MKKILMLALTCLLVACGGNTQKSDSEKIVVGGSTSVLPLMEKLVEESKNQNIDVQGGGSSVGATQTISDVFDIGMLSRNLKPAEAEKLEQKIIAHDGISVIVNKDNAVKSVSLQQLKDIYTGKIKNWKELGGEDKEIVLISREEGSGTRSAFEEIVGFKSTELAKSSDVQNSTGAILENVKINKYAIGYVSFGSLKDTVKPLEVDNVAISAETIKNSTYKIARNFIVVHKKDNEKAKKFIEFILSNDGQKVVEKNKFIPVK